MRRHISTEDLKLLREELLRARKMHLDDEGEDERQLELLLRVIKRERAA